MHWIFLGEVRGSEFIQFNNFHLIGFKPELNTLHHSNGYSPIFDPVRFRNKIRKRINEVQRNPQKPREKSIPTRPLTAAAVDEEPSYAFMHAYIAYKYGYCTWSITSLDLFQKMLKNEHNENNECTLIFEDLYLNFPDRPSSIEDILDDKQKEAIQKKRFEDTQKRFSYLPFRDTIFPCLKEIPRRILITIGHKKGSMDRDRWNANQNYLKSLRYSGKKNKTLYKPFAGVFDLWQKSGLWKRFSNRPLLAGEKDDSVSEDEKFKWPPPKEESIEPDSGHSAPGRLLVIAQKLIERSEKFLKNAMTVPDAIHAALLALEAKELLGNRTPTTSLEALALQHQAEITAESMFYGVEYNLNVKDRFKEIEREVKAISRWFSPKTKKRSEVNARLAIIESLAKKFREMNQFEEEMMCLAEARKLRFEFWMRQSPWRWIFWPFLSYLNIALSSLLIFIVIVFLWTVIFGFVYLLFNSNADLSFAHIWKAYSASTKYFFTLDPSEHFPKNIIPDILLAFQGVVAFSNLSLLFAHIYMIITRR